MQALAIAEVLGGGQQAKPEAPKQPSLDEFISMVTASEVTPEQKAWLSR